MSKYLYYVALVLLIGFFSLQVFAAPGDVSPFPYVKESQYKLYTSSVHDQLSSLWARPAGSGGGIASLSNYTYVRRPHFDGLSTHWSAGILRADAHIASIVPAGGHPAAGSDKQVMVNVAGSFAGAAQSRYSSGTMIHQAASRYAHSQEWRGPDNAIQAYMLGSGLLVLGQPYTGAFTVSNWSIPSVDGGISWSGGLIEAASLHSVDQATLIKGTNVLFRNWTSFTMNQFAGVISFLPRSSVPQHTNFRIVLTTGVKDVDGNSLYSNYSSPFMKYSTAGI